MIRGGANTGTVLGKLNALFSSNSASKVTILYLQGQKTTKTITTTKPAVVFYDIHPDYGSIITVSDSPLLALGGEQYIQIVPKGTTVGIKLNTSNDYYSTKAAILEL